MSIRETVIKGTITVGTGQVLDRGLQLLRNIIVARLVSPEDFGIAALLFLTISFLEMFSRLSVTTLLIQSPQGEEPRFQETSQLITALRGLGIALLLFLTGGLMARLFGIPHTAWAFRLLALAPMIRAFVHQDVFRFQRRLNFKPVLIKDVSSQLITTALAWPLAFWLRDYSAILYLMLLHALLRTVVSHLVAERSYKLGWEPVHAREVISFGWPLLINGILLYFIVQGDRFVIGAADTLFSGEIYSKTLLGFYSVAFLLSSSAIEGIWSVISPVLLPLLARFQDHKEQFQRGCRFCVLMAISIAGPCAIFFILMGGWLLRLVFGEQYGAAEPLIVLLGAAQSIRLVRFAATLTALAKGDSRIPTISNATRVLSIILCFIFAATKSDIAWIAASSIVGEFVAVVVSIWMLKHRLAFSIGIYGQSSLIPLIVLILGLILWNADVFHLHPGLAVLCAVGLSLFIWASFLLLFRDFRSELLGIIERFLPRRFVERVKRISR